MNPQIQMTPGEWRAWRARNEAIFAHNDRVRAERERAEVDRFKRAQAKAKTGTVP